MKAALPRIALFGVLVLVAMLLRAFDANPAMAQTQVIGAWEVEEEPPMDGSAPDWQSILPVFLPTTSQQVTPPMGGGAIERVAVRSVNFDDTLYVMLEWTDRTADESSDRVEAFSDAAAIQFPADGGSEVPAICMGQADEAVNIWQWRADQQNGVPGLGENGYVDMYPSTEDLYFTAREAGNPLAQDEDDRVAVQSLLAGGFGTLEVTDGGGLAGNAVRKDSRWMVVFSRPMVASGDLQPTFDGDTPVDVAFAIWDGALMERNGVKSVSAFTQLRITPEHPPRRAVGATEDWPAYSPSNPIMMLLIGFVVLLIATLVGLFLYFRPGDQESETSDAT